VGVLATLAYVNSVPNGFAYDDTAIVAQNEVVTEGMVLEAWTRPYWPRHSENSGLYRPLTVSSFAAEWRVFGSNPAGYHAVNVVAHVGVSLLVLALLLAWTQVTAAALGATAFAVHPLHTEAVANIVGRGELYAAGFALVALWLYDRGRDWSGPTRVWRLCGIGACYFLALGAKEIAVTLPGLMLLTDFLRTTQGSDGAETQGIRATAALRETWRDLPSYGICAAALGAYLIARFTVVGALLGDHPAPSLLGLTTGERLATAVGLWPHYLRLLLFPFSLSVDYSPAVLSPLRSFAAPNALAGFVVLGALGMAVLIAWRRSPLIAFGIVWFVAAISPVSQVFFPTGVLLAERTLYLPSVGLAAVLAGVWTSLSSRLVGAQGGLGRGRALYGAAAVLLALLMARTVSRNPTWMSTYTALETLAREHPESSLALRMRATGLAAAGDIQGASDLYEVALVLSPTNYASLIEVGNFHGEHGAWAEGERLLKSAIVLSPERPAAYRALAHQLIQRQRYRDAHRTALDGLRAAGADRELYVHVSETYVAKLDFAAAVRARQAALGQDPSSLADLERLAELFSLAGDPVAAAHARAQAQELGVGRQGPVDFTPTGRIVRSTRHVNQGSGT
jgi:hypothetical protein